MSGVVHDGSAVAASDRDRARAAVTEHRAGEPPPIAEPPMPATTRPPGQSLGVEVGRLHAPQRVAQVLGEPEHVGELAGAVDGGDRLGGQLEPAVAVKTRSLPPAAPRRGRYASPALSVFPAPSGPPRRSRRRPRAGSRRRCGTRGHDRRADRVSRLRSGRRQARPSSRSRAPAPTCTPGRARSAVRRRRPAAIAQPSPITAGARTVPCGSAAVDEHAAGAPPAGPRSRCCTRPRGSRRSPAGSAAGVPMSSQYPVASIPVEPVATSVGNTSRSIEIWCRRAPSRRARRARGCRRRR